MITVFSLLWNVDMCIEFVLQVYSCIYHIDAVCMIIV